jgi:hypothetical protein
VPDALHQQCLDATRTILTGLTLAGIAANVVEQLLADDSNLGLPVLRLTIEGEAETIRRLSSAAREVGYPVRVEMADAVSGPGGEKLPGWTAWRDAIEAAFSLDGRAEYPAGVWGVDVLPGFVVDGGERGSQRAAGSLTLRFKAIRRVGV